MLTGLRYGSTIVWFWPCRRLSAPGPTSGLLYSFGGGSGSFAGLACSSTSGSCGTIKNIANFASEPATASFLTLTTGTSTAISFDLTSVTGVAHGTDLNGGSVTFTANGTINYTGFDATAGTFILTAQGNNIVSFSATTLAAAAVPEPASLAVLGASLAGLGLIRADSGVMSPAIPTNGRPAFRADVAHHSDLMSPTIPT